MVTETIIEKIERNLSLAGDATPLRGKFLIQPGFTSSPSNFLPLYPFNLGPRASAFANNFARYRFKQVSFRFSAQPTSSIPFGSPGQAIIGILDDFVGEGDGPVSAGGVAEMRTSASNWFTQTTCTELVWKPPTREWFYTYAGSTGSEQRLVFAGEVYIAGSAPGICSVEVTFQLVFKSAVDVGSSVSIVDRDDHKMDIVHVNAPPKPDLRAIARR